MFSHIPNTAFLPPAEDDASYGIDTGGAHRPLGGTVVVLDAVAIPAIIEVANREGLKLWPISGGRNFGYGTSLPVEPGSFIVDMTRLKEIVQLSI